MNYKLFTKYELILSPKSGVKFSKKKPFIADNIKSARELNPDSFIEDTKITVHISFNIFLMYDYIKN